MSAATRTRNTGNTDRDGRNARGLAGRLTRLASCCVAVAFIWACGPVYIPVPPPEAATLATFSAELVTTDPPGAERQLWTTAGPALAPASNATYYIFDQERNAGVIAKAAADGSYLAPPMEGTEGDHVQIQYRTTDGDDSDVACLLLSEARPLAARCPPQ